jgi:hypothetical protein
MLETVPERTLITTDVLRRKLADQFGVQGCCPVTTRNALQAIADDPRQTAAYWRVISQTGALSTRFPGGVEGHAARLQDEGFVIDRSRKPPRVKDFKRKLVDS